MSSYVYHWDFLKVWLMENIFISTVSVFSVQLPLCVQTADVRRHCSALSSDEDSMEPAASCSYFSSKRPLRINLHSSGYSSVQSSSPSTASSSSSLVPCHLSPVSLSSASVPASPGFRLLVPMQRPCGSSHRQVKRKKTAAHSCGEMEREDGKISADEQAFLSLWRNIWLHQPSVRLRCHYNLSASEKQSNGSFSNPVQIIHFFELLRNLKYTLLHNQ